jgi:MFS family permease
LPREVPVLTSVAFSVAIGFGIVAPALPEFARHFGVSTAVATTVISAFAGMRLAFSPAGGWLVNTFGERTVMATGIVIVAVSSALAGLSQDFVELIVLRGVGGAGSAMFGVSARSLLLRSVTSEQRGRASGLFSGGFLLGGVSGPFLGGLVATQSLRIPFFLYAGLLAVPASIAFVLLRGRVTTYGQTGTGGPTTRLATVLRDKAFRAALGGNAARGWAVMGVRSALLPLFVLDVLHRSPLWTGIGFGVVAVVNGSMLIPAGRLADARGRRPVLMAGCLVAALGMVLLALLPSLGGYLGALVVFGVGSGLLDIGPSAVIGDVVAGRGGGVIAAYQMAGDAGVVSGPIVGGWLADSLSYAAAFGVTAGILALAALLALRSPETRWRATAEPAAPEPAERPAAAG